MSVDEHMEPALVRAARAVLDWTMMDLAQRSGVSAVTVRDYENAKFKRRPRGMNRANKMAIARAIEEAGIQFVGGPPPGILVHRPELLDNPPRPRKIARKIKLAVPRRGHTKNRT
jgi:transcriptional regulator with XRE-family HTH domain